jgi:serine protease Do
MLRRILLPIFVLSVLASVAYTQPLTSSPSSDVYGFSSEDFGDSSYLGVDTRDITPDRLSVLHLKEETGVEITMVDQDAPAGKAGLKEQDVILTLNGEKIVSVEQLRRMIRETPSGRVITLGVSRNGTPMTFKVQLADRKNSFAYSLPKAKDFHFEMPALPTIPEMDMPVSIVVVHSSARSGLMVENLTPQLGDFFGVKNGQGVLVRSVEKGSRADKAGFRAGDVIVKINGEPIHDAGDFSHALRSRRESNSTTVSILRDKKEQTITFTLPERNKSQLNSETLEVPEFDADTLDLSQLQSEWARIGPEMEEAINRSLLDMKPELDQELQKIGPEIQRQQKELCSHKREIQKQMREMQRQMRDRLREMKRLGLQQSADI